MLLRRYIDRYLPFSLHLLAWSIFALVIYSVNPMVHKPSGFAYYYGTKFFSQVFIFYFNYSFLIPRILSRLRIITFLLLNLAAMILLSAGCQAFFGAQWHVNRPFMMAAILLMANDTVFLLLALVIRFSTDWFRHKLKIKQAENETLKSELYFLKAQINPHFLFNSLNNLYALVLKNDKNAPEVILGISQIMRYLLYETNEPLVPLADELSILKAYDKLQQLRDRNKQDIVQVEGDAGQLQIAPLLLLPLTENLYKHGVPPYSIGVIIEDKQLTFSTMNALNKEVKNGYGGVGLANLRRRLELLYPGRFELTNEQAEEQFKSTLTINLRL